MKTRTAISRIPSPSGSSTPRNFGQEGFACCTTIPEDPNNLKPSRSSSQEPTEFLRNERAMSISKQQFDDRLIAHDQPECLLTQPFDESAQFAPTCFINS
jgi:hypothetical protein